MLGPATYVGLDNWNETFAGPLVRTSIINTLVYSAMAIPAVFIIAMVFALALRTVPRGEAPIRVALYVPTLQPAVVSALIFTFVLHPDFGIINFMVRSFGAGPINFLGDTSLALPTIAGIEVWRGIGFWTILFLAGLLAQPQDLHHAAELDGAGAARRFFRLTLPLLLLSVAIPVSALIISLFFVVRHLGLLNTYWALILPPLANPLGIFMARSFVAGIPDDLEASARLDGASELTIYRRIVLPLIRPGLVVLGMFIFMLQYTSFLWPLVAVQDTDLAVLTVGISGLQSAFLQDWGLLSSGMLLAAVPITIIFLTVQRTFIVNDLSGALKE